MKMLSKFSCVKRYNKQNNSEYYNHIILQCIQYLKTEYMLNLTSPDKISDILFHLYVQSLQTSGPTTKAAAGSEVLL